MKKMAITQLFTEALHKQVTLINGVYQKSISVGFQRATALYTFGWQLDSTHNG